MRLPARQSLCLLLCSSATAALFAAPLHAAPRTVLCLDPAALAADGHVHSDAPAGRLIRLAQATDAAPAESKPDKAKLAAELGDMLQACSYDGSALRVSASALTAASSGDGREVVDQIMKFTGLPPNFEVVEGPVPNAAAMIVLDDDDLPVRVIAYNRDFISEVRAATADNDWAPISIMAHEIGHHLSGHTLVPGGSQPPIELEADRFSGFVLNKMGASLPDTTRAIETLIPEADGETHPGRAKRLKAVTSGWTDSCEQSGQPDCASPPPAVTAPGAPAGAPVVATAPEPPPATAPSPNTASPDTASPVPASPDPAIAEPARPAPGTVIAPDADLMARDQAELEAEMVALMGKMGDPGVDQDALLKQLEAINIALANKNGMTVVQSGPDLTQTAAKDILPDPDPQAIPRKTDRFVYDELGILNPEVKAKMEQQAYDMARDHGVEVVSIVTDDLKGLSPDDFAAAMMRQLRVGKMDVGNGAVFVMAPNEQASGLAIGPGLAINYGHGEGMEQLRGYPASFIDSLSSGATPNAPLITEQVGLGADRVFRDAAPWDWEVRFPSLAAVDKTWADYQQKLKDTGEAYDPEKNPIWRRMVRVELTVTDRTPGDGDLAKFVNPGSEALVGPALTAKTPEGRNLMLYASPIVEQLMTAPLEAGKTYSMVLREEALDIDPSAFAVVSYDLLAQ